MYAVIETGGKQYRVEVGTELEVELLDVAPGDAITLDRVLLVADGDSTEIGRPIVENATVAAEVLRQIRGEKTISFKYRPKARRRVKKGHRQELMVLRISDIVLGGRSAAADVAKIVEARKTERSRLEDAARQQAAADAALAAKLAPKSKAEPAAALGAKGSKAPAKAPTKAKANPPAKAKAKAPAKAKATPPAKAKVKTASTAEKTAAAPAAAKTTRPRAAKAQASKPVAPEAKPKRARATKKDE